MLLCYSIIPIFVQKSMPHLNVEIKASCHQPDAIRKILQEHHACFVGTDHQIDTYFEVPKGRLKLREGNIENHLIHYQRDNQSGPKTSAVNLYPSTPGSSLKATLSQALEIMVVVDKQREIYFINNVKFHLDTVKGLGSFVEIEAIDAEGNIGKEMLFQQCSHYLKLFKIKEEDLIAASYSDMLRNPDCPST